MTDTLAPTKLANLDRLGIIEDGYHHHPRTITPAEPIALTNTILKWHDVHRPERPVSAEIHAESRAFLEDEAAAGNLPIADYLGFVVLHQCDTVIFLIVCVWQGNNELWKTVYHKDIINGVLSDGYQLLEYGSHTPTFCVWEMGAVFQEQQAWIRYLYSAHDEAAKLAYLADQHAGTV